MVPWPDPNPDMDAAPGLDAGSQPGQILVSGRKKSGHDRPVQRSGLHAQCQGSLKATVAKYKHRGGQDGALGRRVMSCHANTFLSLTLIFSSWAAPTAAESPRD